MLNVGAHRQSKRSRFHTCAVERLEPRTLLSAGGIADLTAQPLLVRAKATAGQAPFTPAQISHAYGFDSLPRLANNVSANGSGQTIAIVDAFDDPTVAADLQTFDSQFGLKAPPSFTKVNQTGGTVYPPVGSDWTIETAMDVEWAHAMAPGASILLVEANTDNLSDLLAAIDYARHQPGVSVVSLSWGLSEFPQETQLDGYFTTPTGHEGVSFVAAAGDNAAPADWPATSPYVLAVGGTSLTTLGAAGTYRSETGWGYSSGGVSQYEWEPNYQLSVQDTWSRTAPDVAYDADPNSGFWVYNTTGDSDTTGWLAVGGTSAGTPQWAAILAIANQGRAALHRDTLRAAPADIYQLPSGDFHDVASGYNGFSAGPGYDLVTGRGSPLANRVVQDLLGASVQTVEAAADNGHSNLLASVAARPRSLPSTSAMQRAVSQRAKVMETVTFGPLLLSRRESPPDSDETDPDVLLAALRGVNFPLS